MSRCACWVFAAALAFAASEAVIAEDAGDTFAGLGWLAGCWQLAGPSSVTEEQWMAPSGGTMLGMSRTVANGVTTAHEYLRIVASGGKLQYVATPSGQHETVFTEVARDTAGVTFANPEHDFPQRIAYRLQPDGSLLARIEGVRGGSVAAVDFPMRRVACPGATTKGRVERPER